MSLTAQRKTPLPPALHCFWQIMSPLMLGISAFISSKKMKTELISEVNPAATTAFSAGLTEKSFDTLLLYSKTAVLPSSPSPYGTAKSARRAGKPQKSSLNFP